MSRLLFSPATLTGAVLTPPISKSDAHRALVLARVLGLPDPLPPDAELPGDVKVLRDGLDVLARGGPEIDCRDAGAPFRFLLAQAAVTPGARVRFVGSPRLAARPHGPLFAALGLEPRPGVLAEVNGASQDAFVVSSEESSQFASAVLLAAAAVAARTPGLTTAVSVVGAPVSDGYLQMTLRWMRTSGFIVTGDRDFRIRRASPRAPGELPGDWSSLGYLLPIAWKVRGRVERLSDPYGHPDGAVVRHLAGVGLTLEADGRVTGELRGHFVASANQSPDLIPTLAAVACGLKEPSRFTDCAILRGKESDRVEGIIALAAAARATTRLEGDTLILTPPAASPGPIEFHSRGDHRLAMSAAVLAMIVQRPLSLEEPECVVKSFPGFWEQLGKCALRMAVQP